MIDLFRQLKASGGLCVGAAAVGNQFRPVDERDGIDTMVAAIRAGINYIDTAPQYGLGLSEIRVGSALRMLETHERPVIATKVGRVLLPTFEPYEEFPFVETLPFKVVFDYTYDGIKRSVEASLNRLGVNAVDVLHIHNIDSERHPAEVVDHYLSDLRNGGFRALEELKRQGLTKAIGLGNNIPEMCCRILREFPLDVVMVARGLTLLDGSACTDLLQMCRKKNVALLSAAPFCSGILAKDTLKNARFNLQSPSDQIVEAHGKIAAVCAAHDVPIQAAALQYALLADEVMGVVAGLQTQHYVQTTLEWMNVDIPEAFWADLFAQSHVVPLPVPITE